MASELLFFMARSPHYFMELLTTIIAIILTIIPCALLVLFETREQEKQDKIEKAKVNKLKYWLAKCAERNNEKN